ncbi:MAG: hypothetical protein LC713_01630 [Actinobacteria bacterium]|nr:hypothetical protein [Actinomycetota bacterium]
MLSNRPAPPRDAPTEIVDEASSPPVDLPRALLAFVACAAATYLVMALVVPHLPLAKSGEVAPRFTGPTWLKGWAQWDSGWYFSIAGGGYSYFPGDQSPIAFFPAYPVLIRWVSHLVHDGYVAGILITLVAGAGLVVMLLAWLRDRLSPTAAWTALGIFLLYPYTFYLYGVVYADAVFIAAILGAFLLLESDHPWLAGLAGAVATAARPLGPVLVIGLVVRALERRGALRPQGGGVVDLRRARPGDLGVLLSVGGLVAWCAYLWAKFGDPIAFITNQEAWHQGAGPATWFKIQFFKDVIHVGHPLGWMVFVAHAVLTVAALALLPRVFRRFGLGYGVYTALLIGMASLSTKNFFGMARYLLAAFPCFAVLGELLAERVALRRLYLSLSGAGLLLLTAVFGTGYYLS